MTNWYKIRPLKGPCWDDEEHLDQVLFTAEVQFAATNGDQPPSPGDKITTLTRQVFYDGRTVLSWGLGTIDTNPKEVGKLIYSVLEDLIDSELMSFWQENIQPPETFRYHNPPGICPGPGTLPANPANHDVDSSWQRFDLVGGFAPQ